MKKLVYIYTLSCPFNGQVKYVGITTRTIEKRFKEHLKCRNKTYRDAWIKSVIKKGKLPVIETIDVVSGGEWKFWEQHYISLYKSWGFKLTNISHGGEGALGVKRSDEEKKRLSDIKRQWYIDNPERKNDLANMITLEMIAKVTKQKIGRKRSAQAILNMSIYRTGRKMKPHRKEKRNKIVYQFDATGTLVDTHPSVTIAANTVGVTQSAISKAANSINFRKIAGFVWSFNNPLELKIAI